MSNDQKILLLDDNKDLLLVVQIILKGQGYQTVVASSVDEAERKISVHKPSLILMDVCIGDQDGREFCNRLKHDDETHNIRVIMMSGYENDPEIVVRAGADDFIQKPFMYDDLLQHVETQYMYALQEAS